MSLRYVVGHCRPLQAALDSLFASVTEGSSALTQQSALLACVCAAAEMLGTAPADPQVLAIPQRIRRAVAFLRDHFADDISLEQLAAASGGDVHPRYLLTSFKREVGVSPHQYVLRLRVQKARDLLAKGVLANPAAVAVGFCDAAQLHGHFVRFVGMTPGAYAKAMG